MSYLSGFLAPDCRWYPCGRGAHREYSYELLDSIDSTGRLKRDGVGGEVGTDALLRLGWLHLQDGYALGGNGRAFSERHAQWLWDHLDGLQSEVECVLRAMEGDRAYGASR